MSAPVTLGCAVIEAGSCVHVERLVVREGRWRPVRLPVLVGVLRHPVHGVVLFDTGLAPRVRRAAEAWPRSLYPWLIPFSATDRASARTRLLGMGISANEVRTVVLSHFHPDHVGGLRDFPRARIVASKEAWRRVEGAEGWTGLRRGHLPALLPEDFESRLVLVDGTDDGPYGPFPGTHDLLGDGSLRLIPLPGHAAGHLGLLAELGDERRVFFVADACWVSAGYRRLAAPSRLTRIVTDDHRRQRETLERIHKVWRDDPGLFVVPSHCPSLAGGAACA